jgi:two-component sensor histidine kinase
MRATTSYDTRRHEMAPTLLPPLSDPTAADEANHRIANNLQLLSVLVASEARLVSDVAGRAALDRTQARLAAIMGIHRQLYAAPDADRVDLGEYLRALCDDLSRSLPAHRPLFVATDRAEARGEMAAALGVLVAELVLNACKHAYPGDAPGGIMVSLATVGDGEARLTVEDRGCGRSALASDGGLGSRLIDTTVRRLRGTARWERAEPGTRFLLHFSLCDR